MIASRWLSGAIWSRHGWFRCIFLRCRQKRRCWARLLGCSSKRLLSLYCCTTARPGACWQQPGAPWTYSTPKLPGGSRLWCRTTSKTNECILILLISWLRPASSPLIQKTIATTIQCQPILEAYRGVERRMGTTRPLYLWHQRLE